MSHYFDSTGVQVQVREATPMPVKLMTPSGGGGNPGGDGAVNTGMSSSVASVTTVGGVTILAANTARYGASVYNTDANDLYLLLGAGTVSATVFTVIVPSGGLYEVPFGFTGILTGVWAADGSGSAFVTEFT